MYIESITVQIECQMITSHILLGHFVILLVYFFFPFSFLAPPAESQWDLSNADLSVVHLSIKFSPKRLISQERPDNFSSSLACMHQLSKVDSFESL